MRRHGAVDRLRARVEAGVVGERRPDQLAHPQPGVARVSDQPGRADLVAVEELADHQPPARLQHPAQLAQRGGRIGDLAERGDQVGGVEAGVLEGQLVGIGQGGPDAGDALPLGPAHHVVEHRLLDVDDVQPAARPQLRGDVQGLQPGAGTDLQDPLTGAGFQQAVQPAQREERQRQVQQPVLGVRVGRGVEGPPGRDGRRGRDPAQGLAVAGEAASERADMVSVLR